MRFLADENCDMAVIDALREAGHDVALARERCPGAQDLAVASLALQERRILLTEDKDFGHLTQAVSATAVGVILIRYPAGARSEMAASVVRTVTTLGVQLEKAFAVLEPGKVRITKLEP